MHQNSFEPLSYLPTARVIYKTGQHLNIDSVFEYSLCSYTSFFPLENENKKSKRSMPLSFNQSKLYQDSSYHKAS